MKEILKAIESAGGKPYFVGGYVRDKILGKESKDIDIEVFGLQAEELHSILASLGKVDLCGKSFGVWKVKHNGQDYDFSLPRRENKIGVGHRDFEIESDHTMTIQEAAGRRDFTMNAISMDSDGSIIDPYNGVKDVENKILSATTEFYCEDALRVERGMQFCSRFNLVADEKTIKLSQSMLDEAKHLPVERHKEEWLKWTKGSYPMAGLNFLEQTKHLSLYPMIDKLRNLPQDEERHPEGDVFIHTKLVCQAMAEICDRENITGEKRAMLFFSALCHDFGKVTTTVKNKHGRWSAPQHDEAGVEPTKEFLISHIGIFNLVPVVTNHVRNHMCHINWDHVKKREKFIRNLAFRMGPASIEDLILLIEADHSGRPPRPKKCPDSALEMLEMARKLGVNWNPEPPKVLGRDLIEAGLEPSPKFKEILSFAYKIQMNGLDKEKCLKQAISQIKD